MCHVKSGKPQDAKTHLQQPINGYRKPQVVDGVLICMCTEPIQCLMPDNTIMCLRCDGIWYH
jgi:hypothetical protein